MSGGSKKQTVGYRYLMGLHFGVCQGPVDALLRIIVGDRTAWQGEQTASGSVSIEKPDLFGGEEREGGVQGTADVMMGDDAQTANAYLTSVQGAPQPAYRGLLSVVFRNGLISANNPYIKPWHFRVRRILQGWHGGAAWYADKATVPGDFSATAEAGEQFMTLEPYITESGNRSLFSVAYSPYGGALNAASQNTMTAAEISRSLPVGFTPESLSFYVQVTAANSDDGCAVYMTAGASQRFYFNPRRETFYDAQSRPTMSFGGSARFFMGTAGMQINTWHRFELTWGADIGDWTATLTNVSTGAVIATHSGTSAEGLQGIDALHFSIDSGGTTSPTQFAQFSFTGRDTLATMNPAHIVYQCLTDPEWGMGYSAAMIDAASFTAAADTFYAEGMGLCLHWTQQQPIEAFIQTVMDHAGAVLRQDPRTGLFQIKPLRGDYDAGTLPWLDETNIGEVSSFERAGLAEAVNEVTVRFNDAETGKAGSVTVQNLAAVTASGGVIAQTTAYPGLPTASLAQRVAMRDLRVLSTPLARVRLRCTRAAYGLLPGDVVRWAWPKLGVASMVLRIVRVNTGTLTDGTIEIDAAEDVFGLGASTYVAQAPIGWQEPSTTPTPTTVRRVIEAPYYDLQRALSAADLAILADDAGYLLIGASRPSGAARAFDLLVSDGGDYEQTGSGDYCASGTLSAAMSPADTEATLSSVVDPELITAGAYALIDDEIVRVDAFDALTSTLTLGRGVLDTVAAAHDAGAVALFMGEINATDSVERVGGETVNIKLLTLSGTGRLAEDWAPIDAIEFDSRAHRPYPPGRLRVNGSAYPATVTSPVSINWAHRDRLLQNLEGDETGSIGPEAGTTYSARLLALPGESVFASVSGLGSTLWSISPSPPTGSYILEAWSVRGGVESLQRHRFAVSIEGAAADPLFAYVVLLLHCDGTNGSTTFVDSSASAKTVTAVGNAQISDTSTRFGSGCALFDGGGDYLWLADSSDWAFGNGDFTIEFFYKFTAVPTGVSGSATNNQWIYSQRLDGVNYIYVYAIGGGIIFDTYSSAGGQGPKITSNAITHDTTTYHHCAITRYGNTFTIWIDGANAGSQTNSSSMPDVASAMDIGRWSGGGGYFNGRIDELRITKGAARYTAAFTAPSAPFPGDAQGEINIAAAVVIDPTIPDAPIGVGINRATWARVFAANGDYFSVIQQIANPTGSLSSRSLILSRFDGATRSLRNEHTLVSGGVYQPVLNGVSFDPDRSRLAVSWSNGDPISPVFSVSVINTDTALMTDAGSTGRVDLTPDVVGGALAVGVAVRGPWLYLAGGTSRRIQRVDPATGAVQAYIATAGGFAGERNIDADDEHLVHLDAVDEIVLRALPSLAEVTRFTVADDIKTCPALIGGEILAVVGSDLVRYSKAGSVLGTYAITIDATTGKATRPQRFGRYVVVGDDPPAIFDVLAAWATVSGSGYAPPNGDGLGYGQVLSADAGLIAGTATGS